MVGREAVMAAGRNQVVAIIIENSSSQDVAIPYAEIGRVALKLEF
jgi:hypothetical protein